MAEEKIIIAEDGMGERHFIPESKVQQIMDNFEKLKSEIRAKSERDGRPDIAKAADKQFTLQIVKDERSENNNSSN